MNTELLSVKVLELSFQSSVIWSSQKIYPSQIYMYLKEPPTKMFQFCHRIRNGVSGTVESSGLGVDKPGV